MIAWGLILVGLLLLTGLALLAWGWRGRRVGDHPHCRACGFDLFGLIGDAATCPECGADVQRRPPVVGQRRRRRTAIAAGIVLLLLGAAVAIPPGWRQTPKQSLYRHAPGFYLVWVVNDEDARQELAVRLQNGVLSAATARSLADAALDVQGDPAQPWNDQWGRLIEIAWQKNLLTTAQIERYIRQATPPIVLAHRPRVQLGRKPAIYLDVDSSYRRLGPITTLNVQAGVSALSIDGQDEKIDPTRRSVNQAMEKSSTPPGRGWSGGSYYLLRKPLDDRLGDVPVRVDYELTRTASLPLVTPPITLVDSGRVTATIAVVAEPTGQYVTEEVALAEQAQSVFAWFGENRKGEPELVITFRNQPHRLDDAQVWFVLGGQVVAVDDGWTRGGGWARTTINGREALRQSFRFKRDRFDDLLEHGRVDIVVRPDFKRAEESATIEPVWLGEWRFAGVPVAAQGRPGSQHSIHQPPPDAAVRPTAHALTTDQAHQPPTVEPRPATSE